MTIDIHAEFYLNSNRTLEKEAVLTFQNQACRE